MKRILLLLILKANFGLYESYGSGAPASACDSMKPGHGTLAALTSTPPFRLRVSPESVEAVEAGANVELVLEGISSSDTFKGFIVQAFDSSTNQRVGSFNLDNNANAKGVSCGTITNSAVTHNGKTGKSSMALSWLAPDSANGSVDFRFSVVKDYSNFWVKAAGPTVQIVPKTTKGNPDTTPTSISTSSTEATTTTSGSPIGESAPISSPSHPDYDGCGSSKGCFGQPSGCTTSRTCSILLAYSYAEDTQQYSFLLHAKTSETNKYMALGLSTDAEMGSDLVIFCPTKTGGQVGVKWNSGKSNVGGVTGLNFVGTKPTKSVDGAMSCEFTLPESANWTFNGQGNSYNLGNGELHALIAFGDLVDGDLQYHTSKLGSAEPVAFKSISTIAVKGEGWLAQVHAVLMILAWMGCAATGMLIARYYKKTWTAVKPGGKDLWFRVHQLSMGLTFLLTFTAFFVMVGKEGVDPLSMEEIKINPHPAFGITCFAATLIQPLMAALRPSPDADYRWMFNWAHWFVGNVGFICAIVAIFLGMEYDDMHMPVQVTYVLIAYVCFHIAVHVVLTIQRCYIENHEKNRVKDIDSSELPQDAWGSGLRKAFAFIYTCIVWIFTFVILSWVINRRIASDGSHHDESGEAEPES